MGDTQRYSISEVTPPASEPVTLDETKLHLRVDEDADDDYITSLIKVAREDVEMRTRRTLMPTVFDMFLDRFPNPYDSKNPYVLFKKCPYQIPLPRLPLLSLSDDDDFFIKYYDTNGDIQELIEDTDFEIDRLSLPARVRPVTGLTWPDTYDKFNAVNIRFTAGYLDAASVPEVAKQGMKLIIGDIYENRESTIAALNFQVGKTLDRLLAGITFVEL